MKPSVCCEPELASDDRGELVLADLAGLQAAQVAARLLVGAEQVEEGVRVEPLAVAEVAEGLEHVGGQDATEVDQQGLHSE